MPSQLFQRDSFNKAIVPIKGNLYTEGYTDISILVKRDKKNYQWQKQKLSYQTSAPKNAPFSFLTEIRAELLEYSFNVYLHKGKDSLLIKEQNEVICGDIFLIYGQSNALANDADEIAKFNGENQFGRTAFGDFEKNEFVWFPVRKWNYWSVGLLGLEVQKQLIDKYKIPIALINGSEGNKSIAELMLRDDKLHDNISTIYGRLLKKSKGLGIEKTVRGIIWRQGEAEALDMNYKNDYGKQFDLFRKEILEDYPSIKKFYTFQNNIYFGPHANAGNLREYQRTIKSLYPECEVLATYGTVTFDNLHYSLEGYQQNGQELSRLMAHDFYQSKDTLEIYSPNIKKIYITPKKDSLILEFDRNQRMYFPQGSLINSSKISSDLKDYIYLDGKSGNILSGIGFENLIILKLKEPQIVENVTYTPDFYTFDMAVFLPGGLPQIKNSRGLRALTFKNFPVTKLSNIEIESFVGSWNQSTKKSIVLNWLAPKFTNYTYSLEKAIYSPLFFNEIASLNGSEFIDYKVKKGISYFYRLHIKQEGKGSAYSSIIEVKPSSDTEKFLVQNEDLMLFPNPVQKGNDIQIYAPFDNPIKTIRVINFKGGINETQLGNDSQHQYSFKTDDLASGMYIIETILVDNTKLIKKFVVE